MSLAKVLETDFRLLHHMCHISNDFVEGIRAKLIEKDNNARWKPATVDEVCFSICFTLEINSTAGQCYAEKPDMCQSFFMCLRHIAVMQ